MNDLTPLDTAHAAMLADPDSDAARLGFYERLADCELFLMLQSSADATQDTVTPELFELDDARYVLVFDREERLATFAGQSADFVSLSGRAIAGMLAGQGIGLGVNLDVAPSSILLPETAVSWLHDTLGNAPQEVDGRISEVAPPSGLPESLIQAIDAKLATAMGLAASAYLTAVVFENGTRGHLLGFVDTVPQAQDALKRAMSEALTFSGIEAGALDIAFFDSANPITASLERVGLRFDLPQMQKSVTQDRAAPGMDPANPPKLK